MFNILQFLKMLEIGLDPDSFSLEGCHTGKEALRLFLMLRPGLVILDVNLPDITGYEIITGIREWSQTPIIMLSARGQDQDIVKALDLGADDYVTKPFSLKVLESRINATTCGNPPRARRASPSWPIARCAWTLCGMKFISANSAYPSRLRNIHCSGT